MSIEQREFTYQILRKIVMALHNQGLQLKQEGLSFSHGNVGNEFLDVARYFDQFVADLEPREILVMVKQSALKGAEALHQNKFEELMKAYEYMREIDRALGLEVGHGKSETDRVNMIAANTFTVKQRPLLDLVVARRLGRWMAEIELEGRKGVNPYAGEGPLYDGGDSMGLAAAFYEAYKEVKDADEDKEKKVSRKGPKRRN